LEQWWIDEHLSFLPLWEKVSAPADG